MNQFFFFFLHSLIIFLLSAFLTAVEDVQNVQIVCVWCQKEGVKRYSLCMGSELKSFCSEKCFAACRRAYFKRNKVSGKCKKHTNISVDGNKLIASGASLSCTYTGSL